MTTEILKELQSTGGGNRTSALEVDDWQLELDLQKIEQQWKPLRAILQDRAAFRSRLTGVSAWSAGLQAGHSILVAELVATLIRRLLENPEMDCEKEPAPFMEEIFRDGVFPRGRAKAPKHVLPYDRTRHDFLALAAGAQRNWERLTKRQTEIAKTKSRYPHIVFGYLTPAEWTRFGALHTTHHLKIAAEILEASQD